MLEDDRCPLEESQSTHINKHHLRAYQITARIPMLMSLLHPTEPFPLM
jgi:hypothetical protein